MAKQMPKTKKHYSTEEKTDKLFGETMLDEDDCKSIVRIISHLNFLELSAVAKAIRTFAQGKKL